jgi:hypothetical protein
MNTTASRRTVVLLAAALAGCGNSAQEGGTPASAGAFDFETDVGIAVTDTAGVACLRTPGNWKQGNRLFLINALGVRRIDGAVIGHAVERCAEERQLDDLPGRQAVVAAGLEPSHIFFALNTAEFSADTRGESVITDLDGDGEAEMLRVCNSTEGLHLSIWTGAPGAGTRRWHRYLYFGYDMVPTCTDADFPGT